MERELEVVVVSAAEISIGLDDVLLASPFASV